MTCERLGRDQAVIRNGRVRVPRVAEYLKALRTATLEPV